MEGSIRIQGRDLSADDVEHIRGLIALSEYRNMP